MTRRAGSAHPSASGGTSGSHAWNGWLPVAVLAFAALAYSPALRVPFIGDDYVFLDKTRSMSFLDLWSLGNTDFGWYRPWSREFHFWILRNLVGPHELGFRIASLALWLGTLLAYALVVRHLGGRRVAAAALLGVTSLALWGAPLCWISGTQDLWMLVLALLAMLMYMRGRRAWALLPYAGALLSKETAATIPLILLGHELFIRRAGPANALRRVVPYGLLTLAWVAMHPTLIHRLTHAVDIRVTGEPLRSPFSILGLSSLTLINGDKLLVPMELPALRLLPTITSALVLAIAAIVSLTRSRGTAAGCHETPRRPEIVWFGVFWCAAGWLPLFLPSVGWHAYYGGLGVLGAWVALGAMLESQPRMLAIMLLTTALLRGKAAATPSWDWGSEWYQTRAGNMLSLIRAQLLVMHPSLPEHARLYFGNIPNNIGLIAGQSPALRVWYDDATLKAGFYSYYRPRAAPDPDGRDMFFHFDSTAGIREVDGEPANRQPIGLASPDWEVDQEALAMLFVTNRDLPRAAGLFERLASLRPRPEALVYAAVCWEVHGDSLRARADFDSAASRTGGTAAQIRDWAARLAATMPHR